MYTSVHQYYKQFNLVANKHTFLQDPSKKFKGDVMDLRLDIERRKRFSGKEYKREGGRSPGGSRGPSREKSSEKSGKHHKKSKYVQSVVAAFPLVLPLYFKGKSEFFVL